MVSIKTCFRFLLVTACILSEEQRCRAFSVLKGNQRFPSASKNTPSMRLKPPLSMKNTLPLVQLSEQNGEQDGRPIAKFRKAFWSKQLFRQMCAEAIGTFIIVQLGTGAVMSAIFDNALLGLFQIASVWIIAVTLAVATTGPISGAHLNPAMSIAFAVVRPNENFGAGKLLAYIGSQIVGAICGSLCNLILFQKKILQFEAERRIIRGSVGSIASAKAFGEYFTAPVSTGAAFFAEAFGTAVLAFVVFSLTNPKSDTQKNKVYIPPLIGLAVGGLISVIAPLTQAGLNPARDFGPRVIAYFAGWRQIAFQGWWVYVLAPIVGAVVGALAADRLYGDEEAINGEVSQFH